MPSLYTTLQWQWRFYIELRSMNVYATGVVLSLDEQRVRL